MIHQLPRWSRRRTQEGQTLVEFALVLPVFLLVVFGLFDVGRLVFTNATISQAAREGARVASAETSWIGSAAPSCAFEEEDFAGYPGRHWCPADVAELKTHITTAVNGMTTTLGPIDTVYISCNEGSESDPAPSGDWTEASGGNGCEDESGNVLGGTGNLVSVRVVYSYGPFTPIISSIIGSVPLTGTATMAIN